MARKQLTLGGQTFNSIAHAKKWASELLNSIHVVHGEEITLPKDLFLVLRDILGRHPRIHEKINGFPDSVKEIVIRRSGNGNQFCYVLYGSEPEAFSYKKCLDSPNLYHKMTVTDSFRALVRDQIDNFKESKIDVSGYGMCDLSKIKFPKDELVVDHFVPFSSLLAAFMKECKLKYEDLEVNYNEEDFYGHKPLVDKQVSEKFIEYHRKNAVLCLTHRELNARLGAMKKEGAAFKFTVDAFRKDFGYYS